MWVKKRKGKTGRCLSTFCYAFLFRSLLIYFFLRNPETQEILYVINICIILAGRKNNCKKWVIHVDFLPPQCRFRKERVPFPRFNRIFSYYSIFLVTCRKSRVNGFMYVGGWRLGPRVEAGIQHL